ncbi:hypothetical protein Dda_8233 [Drechslerella dactyloides]|uniref:Uncharacterized protein n=1 Tax=Drechslerella dactyloides TaxID=74499 RepID=A0AAD6ISU5_DREDA|nr:hypothetical protein Dda_8233 [Drechslerella dactyloides]
MAAPSAASLVPLPVVFGPPTEAQARAAHAHSSRGGGGVSSGLPPRPGGEGAANRKQEVAYGNSSSVSLKYLVDCESNVVHCPSTAPLLVPLPHGLGVDAHEGVHAGHGVGVHVGVHAGWGGVRRLLLAPVAPALVLLALLALLAMLGRC